MEWKSFHSSTLANFLLVKPRLGYASTLHDNTFRPTPLNNCFFKPLH